MAAGTGATRRAALAGTASVVVLVAAGCASPARPSPSTVPPSPSPSPSPSSSGHDAADLEFALTMVPHLLQGAELADLVADRSDDADLRALATRVADGQQAGVAQVTRVLGAWGASPDDELSDGEHQAGAAANGMVTDGQLRALAALRGGAFRTEWLRRMVAHHQGALALAREVLASGSSPDVRAIATSLLARQQQELDEMQALLRR